IRLPGINGVEAFIQIKEINPEVKVIMMTGFAVEGLIEESLQQGAYACIHKPFDLEKVISIVEQVLKENKKVVLIANGDSQTREEVRKALTEKGYRIVTAVDAEDVYIKLKNNQCHCILVNLQLPGMNGLKILKEVKELHPNVVVIVMADCGLPEMIMDAKQLSVYGYIKKPVDVDALIRLLKEADV
ncbi:MAG: response regulator, partial [Candidatus Desantisbacteria bacterium]